MRVWIVLRMREIEGVTCESVAGVFSAEALAVEWVCTEPVDRDVSYCTDDYEVDDLVSTRAPRKDSEST